MAKEFDVAQARQKAVDLTVGNMDLRVEIDFACDEVEWLRVDLNTSLEINDAYVKETDALRQERDALRQRNEFLETMECIFPDIHKGVVKERDALAGRVEKLRREIQLALDTQRESGGLINGTAALANALAADDASARGD